MDPKAARRLIDQVCAELGLRPRAAGLAELVKRSIRPVGLGVLIGVGAAGVSAGCAEDAETGDPDVVDSAGDAVPGDVGPFVGGDMYGLPPGHDIWEPDVEPTDVVWAGDAYGLPSPDYRLLDDVGPDDVPLPSDVAQDDVLTAFDAYGVPFDDVSVEPDVAPPVVDAYGVPDGGLDALPPDNDVLPPDIDLYGIPDEG